MVLDNDVALRRKVSQLFVVRASGHIYDIQRNYPKWELTNQELNYLLEEGIGGVILFGGSAWELKSRCKMFRELALSPLLLCADIEEGLGQRFHGGTLLVPPIALSQIYIKDAQRALELAEEYGRCIGYQARSCGLNWVLAPVCDVNTNPDNPVINVRSWGEDASTVSRLISAFQSGLSLEGVLSCAKHFPGHGDSHIDSHIDLPILTHDLSRLEDLEFLPFQAAIASGVNSVMTGHLLLPELDDKHPATLSKAVITNLLREKLAFEGLIVTDALVMNAITRTYGPGQAARMAFEAGADLILMPESIELAIQSLFESFKSGRIPMESLDKSLNRRYVLLEKIKDKYSTIPFQNTASGKKELERPVNFSLSEELVNRSLEIHNPKEIQKTPLGINLLRIDGFLPNKFISNSSPAICIPENAGYQTCLLYPKGISPWTDNPKSPLALDRFPQGLFFLQLFIRGNPFQGKLQGKEPWLSVVKQLQKKNLLSGIVVYGSPYLWNDLREVLNKSIPAAYSPGNMAQVQKKILSCLFHPSILENIIPSSSDLNDFTD